MNVIDEIYRRFNLYDTWGDSLVLKRNDYLKVAGTVDTNLYYITTGSLRMFILHEADEHIIRFGYKHNFIASLDSFLTGKPSEFYIQAIKKTHLRVIPKDKFLAFLQQHPENKRLWDIIVEQLLIQQIEREKDILITSPVERFQRVYKRSPQLFQEIPNKHIASYLRMSPETLSRLKKS